MASPDVNIETSIDFIADLPVYGEEKPFFLHPSASNDVNLDEIKTSNVEWDTKPVTVYSMRDREDISLEKNGFCYTKHDSKCLPNLGMNTEGLADYRKESENFLQSFLNAELVHCYDCKLRKNAPMTLESFDPSDPLLVEQVAVGAHVDISLDTVPRLLKNIITEEQLETFYKPGYRFRLINTWRSILPRCEDRPLAMCDYTSIDANDLVATDRVYPKWNQEIYYLKYNKDQRWYWLPNQRSDEPFLFMTFDSHAGSNARYCPHVSVESPVAAPQAPPRESVETRNLVITKL
ncbi:uncharacterized protein GGS22DRAFT_155174 [Annulohypoxylon maeteangense]|uniref:uncharacterized protein n=1 Tax=Annulohypoxylon maeteangense TaxID=1927788 RepID=UPI002008CA6E|nr:uncharacterized protein GGS22DRAFT_155174 [Annulohypoxylon maeteangense]KAI0888148.1 hypothetical protein GGS22DRAFT_155174 [Annulohypoxylon maeteangense]